MKIYFASQNFYPNIGGVSTHIFNLLTRLNNMGHDVREIHLRSPKEKIEENIKNIQVQRVPRQPITKKSMQGFGKFKDAFGKALFNQGKTFSGNVYNIEGYKQFSEINKLFGEAFDEVLKNHPAEIVHVHDFQFQLIMVYKYITRGIPLILTWHGPFLKNMNRKVKEFIIENMSAYDKVIFLTEKYKKAAIKSGLPKEKTVVIPPIANTWFKKRKVNKKKVKEKFSIPKDSKVILCIQRIDWRSSHKQLIKSMPEVLKKHQNAVLVFVGENSIGSKTLKKEDM